MFEDYQTLVKQHYEKKRDTDELSIGLKIPTDAQIRDQCLIEFNKGILRKDRKIIVHFFKEDGDDNAIRETMRNFKPSDFKALCKYLKGQSISTSPKNIELLAWLIDFEPRPFELGKRYDLKVLEADNAKPEQPQEIKEGTAEEEIEKIEEPKIDVAETLPVVQNTVIRDDNNQPQVEIKGGLLLTAPNPIKTKNGFNHKAVIIAFTSVVAAIIGIAIYKTNGGNENTILGSSLLNKDGGCMYWAGDHYQPIPCSQKVGPDTLVVALDSEKLNSLKKITRIDTITNNAIGKVWYIKIDGKVEFYTASGNYPLDQNRRLKPITEHIITTYIGQQDASR